MEILQSIVLGVIQGITEFLPISSSGHLIFVPELFGWEDQGLAFDVVVHLATLVAVLSVFWKDVLDIGKGMVGKGARRDGKIGWLILFATVPVVFVGLLAGDLIETHARSTKWVALSLLVWGLVLAWADIYSEKLKRKKDELHKLGYRDALFIGLMQAIALLPGTSRSGITMTAGLFSGLDRVAAARFSFLLSIPAIFGAGVLVLYETVQSGVQLDMASLVIGFVSALVAGVLAIRFLLEFVRRSNYLWFAGYRVILAFLIFFLLV